MAEKKSAIADKPRDEFVQTRWRTWLTSKNTNLPFTMPNLVLLRYVMQA